MAEEVSQHDKESLLRGMEWMRKIMETPHCTNHQPEYTRVRLKGWPKGSYTIQFHCPNCKVFGMMHPKQFEEYVAKGLIQLPA